LSDQSNKQTFIGFAQFKNGKRTILIGGDKSALTLPLVFQIRAHKHMHALWTLAALWKSISQSAT